MHRILARTATCVQHELLAILTALGELIIIGVTGASYYYARKTAKVQEKHQPRSRGGASDKSKTSQSFLSLSLPPSLALLAWLVVSRHRPASLDHKLPRVRHELNRRRLELPDPHVEEDKHTALSRHDFGPFHFGPFPAFQQPEPSSCVCWSRDENHKQA